MKTYNIYLFGELTYETAQGVMSEIDMANEKSDISDILLTLCSYGGFNYPAFALYEKIKSSIKKITVKATGTCQSCAVIVLQAGHTRVATEKTTFMLHQIDSGIEKPTYEELQKESNHLKYLNNTFIELTTSKSTISIEDFKKLTANTHYLTSQEALDNGLIDKIVK